MVPLKMTFSRSTSRSSTGPSTGVQSVFSLVLETVSVAMDCFESGVVVTLSTISLLADRTREARRVTLAALGSNIFFFSTGIGGSLPFDL